MGTRRKRERFSLTGVGKWIRNFFVCWALIFVVIIFGASVACMHDGYIVKVLGKRKTIFGTAWYQLNHSTIRTNVKRPHACTWFGVCSYRKMKVKIEKKKSLCPICGEELVRLHYLGVQRIVKDKDSPDYVGSFVDDLIDSDGALNWCEARSGSYG